jgi:hypothetical protein
MKLRVLLCSMAALTAGGSLCLPAAEARRPNVLFIPVDDLNDWIGCLGLPGSFWSGLRRLRTKYSPSLPPITNSARARSSATRARSARLSTWASESDSRTYRVCSSGYSGALRGAGDTVWPGLVTIVYSWIIIVFGGWLMTALFPQIESLGPWLALAAYLIIYGITMTLRFELGRWRSIVLLHDEHEGGGMHVPSPAPPAATADASRREFADATRSGGEDEQADG